MQKQAEEWAERAAEKAKLPNKGLNASKRRPAQTDPDESSSHGLQTQEGELEADDMEYEGSHETATSNSDDDEEDSPKGEGKGQQPADNLNRVSVDSSQATVRPFLRQKSIHNATCTYDLYSRVYGTFIELSTRSSQQRHVGVGEEKYLETLMTTKIASMKPRCNPLSFKSSD